MLILCFLLILDTKKPINSTQYLLVVDKRMELFMNVNGGGYSPLIAGGIVVPPKAESIAEAQDTELHDPNIAGGIVIPPTAESDELQEDVVKLSR